jgi:uncharacterized protein (DUF1330 family)
MSNHLTIRQWASALLCLGVLPAVPRPAGAADSKAYVINEIQVTDLANYKDYAEQVPATLKPFGGVFIVRGGRTDVLSGAAPTGRVAILEFPNLASAKAWHESAEYQRILPMRAAASTSRVYIVEGIAP